MSSQTDKDTSLLAPNAKLERFSECSGNVPEKDISQLGLEG